MQTFEHGLHVLSYYYGNNDKSAGQEESQVDSNK